MEWITKHKRLIMHSFIAILVISCFLGSCSFINTKVGLEDDNLFEESLEQIIEKQIGIDIDLTPTSGET